MHDPFTIAIVDTNYAQYLTLAYMHRRGYNQCFFVAHQHCAWALRPKFDEKLQEQEYIPFHEMKGDVVKMLETRNCC